MARPLGEACWICGADGMETIRASTVPGGLTSRAFAITDAGYGVTGEVRECPRCGFRQCPEMGEVLGFYQDLEDESYEQGRAQRGIQARKLVETVARYRPSGRFLDVGAGSGILVEQAVKAGYQAEGVEPSRWLAEQARSLGLEVRCGTLPQPEPGDRFDVVTLVDVIEHVPNPVEILTQLRDALVPGGVGLVVTPDAGSFTARLLGWRWWHYRIAHIGYFNRGNLLLALRRAGLEPLLVQRPWWYFTAAYLLERVNVYLPRWARLPIPQFAHRLTVPLNLWDSLLVVFTKPL